MPKKRRGRGQRYTATEKQKIMKVALKENLTGAEVQKRFGVSPLTYYRWRGPVRNGAPLTTANGTANDAAIRREIRTRIEQILPKVIREEVDAYLNQLFRKARR